MRTFVIRIYWKYIPGKCEVFRKFLHSFEVSILQSRSLLLGPTAELKWFLKFVFQRGRCNLLAIFSGQFFSRCFSNGFWRGIGCHSIDKFNMKKNASTGDGILERGMIGLPLVVAEEEHSSRWSHQNRRLRQQEDRKLWAVGYVYGWLEMKTMSLSIGRAREREKEKGRFLGGCKNDGSPWVLSSSGTRPGAGRENHGWEWWGVGQTGGCGSHRLWCVKNNGRTKRLIYPSFMDMPNSKPWSGGERVSCRRWKVTNTDFFLKYYFLKTVLSKWFP